jgi:hypothetical protein
VGPGLSINLLAVLIKESGMTRETLVFDSDDCCEDTSAAVSPPAPSSGHEAMPVFNHAHFFRVVAKEPRNMKRARTDFGDGPPLAHSAVVRHETISLNYATEEAVVKMQAAASPLSSLETVMYFQGLNAVHTLHQWTRKPGA